MQSFKQDTPQFERQSNTRIIPSSFAPKPKEASQEPLKEQSPKDDFIQSDHNLSASQEAQEKHQNLEDKFYQQNLTKAFKAITIFAKGNIILLPLYLVQVYSDFYEQGKGRSYMDILVVLLMAITSYQILRSESLAFFRQIVEQKKKEKNGTQKAPIKEYECRDDYQKHMTCTPTMKRLNSISKKYNLKPNKKRMMIPFPTKETNELQYQNSFRSILGSIQEEKNNKKQSTHRIMFKPTNNKISQLDIPEIRLDDSKLFNSQQYGTQAHDKQYSSYKRVQLNDRRNDYISERNEKHQAPLIEHENQLYSIKEENLNISKVCKVRSLKHFSEKKDQLDFYNEIGEQQQTQEENIDFTTLVQDLGVKQKAKYGRQQSFADMVKSSQNSLPQHTSLRFRKNFCSLGETNFEISSGIKNSMERTIESVSQNDISSGFDKMESGEGKSTLRRNEDKNMIKMLHPFNISFKKDEEEIKKSEISIEEVQEEDLLSSEEQKSPYNLKQINQQQEITSSKLTSSGMNSSNGYFSFKKIKRKSSKYLEIFHQFPNDAIFAYNIYSILFMTSYFMILTSYKNELIKTPFLIHQLIYYGFYYIGNKILISQYLKKFFMLLLWCSFQYSLYCDVLWFNKQFVQISSAITLYILFLFDKKDFKRLNEMLLDLIKLIENGLQFKYLLSQVPIGIAVSNLGGINHFNKTLQQSLRVRHTKDVIFCFNFYQFNICLENLQRKVKLNESQNSKDQFNKSQYSDTQSLINDLHYIMSNREQVFKDKDNVFDTYFIDKTHQGSPSNIKRLSSFTVSTQRKKARKYFSISVSQIQWEEQYCLLITLRDITNDKIINQQEVVDKLRNMIFKTFTHELKTPLNGISMSLETCQLLVKRQVNEIKEQKLEKKCKMDSIYDLSKRIYLHLSVVDSCKVILSNVMHDFFDYHQLQTNEIQLNNSEFDLKQFLQDIKKVIKHQLQGSNVKFQCKFKYKQSDQLKMEGDKERLKQILLNLLLNSIKFTSQGEILLLIKIINEDTCYRESSKIKFIVQDTGVGIDESRLPYIFNLFERNEETNLNQILQQKNNCKEFTQNISCKDGIANKLKFVSAHGGVNFSRKQKGRGFQVLFRPTSKAEKRQNNKFLFIVSVNLNLGSLAPKLPQNESGYQGSSASSLITEEEEDEVDDSQKMFISPLKQKEPSIRISKENFSEKMFQSENQVSLQEYTPQDNLCHKIAKRKKLGKFDLVFHQNQSLNSAQHNIDQRSSDYGESLDSSVHCATFIFDKASESFQDLEELNLNQMKNFRSQFQMQKKNSNTSQVTFGLNLGGDHSKQSDSIANTGNFLKFSTNEQRNSVKELFQSEKLGSNGSERRQSHQVKNSNRMSYSNNIIKEETESLLWDEDSYNSIILKKPTRRSKLFEESDCNVEEHNDYDTYTANFYKHTESNESTSSRKMITNFNTLIDQAPKKFFDSINFGNQVITEKSETKYQNVKVNSVRKHQEQPYGHLDKLSQSQISKKSLSLKQTSSVKKRCCPQIVIVDDVQLNRYALKEMMTCFYNQRCVEITNGQECVDYLQKIYDNKKCSCENIRVIFMDIEMPVLNGIEATKKIRQMVREKKMPFIPIVALTAYLDEKERCLKAGMSDFLIKPANSNALKECLNNLYPSYIQ